MTSVDTERLSASIGSADGKPPIELKTEERPRTAGAPTDMRGAVAIATSMKAEVEKVTEFILTSIEDAEKRLQELKAEALADCARLKGELDASIVSAEAIVRQAKDIVSLVSDIRTKRDRVINPGG